MSPPSVVTSVTASQVEEATPSEPQPPDAPWEPQQFPVVMVGEVPPFASVEQAVHEALRDRGRQAFNPMAVHGASAIEEAMVARAYVLRAVDAIEVEQRIAFVLYVRMGSVERVAKALKRRRQVIDARVEAARLELHRALAALGVVP